MLNLKKFNEKSVYRAQIKSLIDNNETEKAVKLFPDVYTTAKEWEEQVLLFIQRNQLDVNRNKNKKIKTKDNDFRLLHHIFQPKNLNLIEIFMKKYFKHIYNRRNTM